MAKLSIKIAKLREIDQLTGVLSHFGGNIAS